MTSVGGALDHLRVIDFGQYVAGPLAAMLLADAGAEVIRVDPPGGPRWRDPVNAVLQRGKRSIVLDLHQASEQEVARRLIQTADVVIEGFRPGVMQRLGLGPQAMLEQQPRLVYCSIPGFAADDPRAALAAYEGVVAAAAGIYWPSTWDPSPDPAPLFNPLPLASTFAALRATESIVAALIVRERTGAGQSIEAPMWDATFELKFDPHRAGTPGRRRHPPRHQFDFVLDTHFACADGRFVNLSWLEGRQLRAFSDQVGLTAELERDGLLDEAQLWSPGPATDELHRRLAAVFKTRSAADWTRSANPAADLSECLTTSEWLDASNEQACASGAVIALSDPEHGDTRQAGYAFKMTQTPLQARSARHPLDGDRPAILADLEQQPLPAVAQPDGQQQVLAALQGFRVVDLTQILAGPTCGRILAEFGAEVTKINAPVGLPVSNHFQVNSGKRTALVNLKTPDGMHIFWRLIDHADVLLMNFSPSTARRLGLDEAAVRQHRPDIVYAVVSCYGWDGPRGEHRGHEQMGQATTGMQERFGRGSPQPVMQSMPICDLGTGNLTALATMLALYHRLRTGQGQLVLGSLAHTATVHQIPFMLDYAARVPDEPAGQAARGYGPLYRLYQASDRWFFLAALGAGALRQLAQVEGLAGVDQLDAAALEGELSHRFAGVAAETWVARLTAAGMGAHVVRTQAECMEDRWAQSHGLSIERDDPQLGPVLMAGPSGRLSRTPLRPMPLPRPPGADNAELLGELGLADQYPTLLAQGTIASSVRSTTARPVPAPTGGVGPT